MYRAIALECSDEFNHLFTFDNVMSNLISLVRQTECVDIKSSTFHMRLFVIPYVR